jgi:hypothetical protein
MPAARRKAIDPSESERLGRRMVAFAENKEITGEAWEAPS